MSYTFLLEQEEASSEVYCWDIDPCALLKSSHIPERFCFNGNATGSCQDSQSGTTSKPSTANLGEVKSMSFAEDSLAKTLVQRERERESKESVQDYGEKWPESLAKYDQSTSTWRTPQCLLFEDLGESLETFPKWGIMQNGQLWELTKLEPPIVEKEYGYSLPTPTATERSGANPNKPGAIQGLTHWIKTWPTPEASDNRDRGCMEDERTKRRIRIGKQVSLSTMVKEKRGGGSLNPNWVEWLMGWPIGHTDLKPLAMDRFQQWRQQHGKF